MKNRVIRRLSAGRERLAAVVRRVLDRLSPVARKWIVLTMLAVFAAVDCYYIASGFRRGNDADTGIRIEHIRPVPLAIRPDSLTSRLLPHE